MEFVHDRLVDATRIRILAVIGAFTREYPIVAVETSFRGKKVASVVDQLAVERGYPNTITVDNWSEFYSKEVDALVYQRSLSLYRSSCSPAAWLPCYRPRAR